MQGFNAALGGPQAVGEDGVAPLLGGQQAVGRVSLVAGVGQLALELVGAAVVAAVKQDGSQQQADRQGQHQEREARMPQVQLLPFGNHFGYHRLRGLVLQGGGA